MFPFLAVTASSLGVSLYGIGTRTEGGLLIPVVKKLDYRGRDSQVEIGEYLVNGERPRLAIGGCLISYTPSSSYEFGQEPKEIKIDGCVYGSRSSQIAGLFVARDKSWADKCFIATDPKGEVDPRGVLWVHSTDEALQKMHEVLVFDVFPPELHEALDAMRRDPSIGGEFADGGIFSPNPQF